ncbi:MAG: polysaccharide deacetylase family protein [Gammaproteobacteria bacterium]|nr:polysaccharide deacetylase family protein [Gammaproteobacteria bacterium]MBU1415997.1 polysaccharide deacetylase family protein [Gammaproteobacteria bacterium]
MADWHPTPLINGSIALHGAALASLTIVPQHWPLAVGAIAANQAVLIAAGLWPRSSLLGPNLTRLPSVARSHREVALTIDDGPDPEVTPRVLDLLDAAGAKATFFCIGEEVTRHAALAREMVARGHAIENHSQHHLKLFAALGPWRMRREIVAAQESIAAAVGRAPRFFRPTAGLRNPFLAPILAKLDLQLASWTRRPFDTRCGDVDRVVARLVRGLAAGDILLMHEGNAAPTAGGGPVILEALPRVLSALQATRLQSVTLTQALDPKPR